MSQSQVPTAPNLDVLIETVTDTRAAPPSATAQMQRIFGELDKAAAQSALIIGAAGRSAPGTFLNINERTAFIPRLKRWVSCPKARL
jgi:hypothetical protein